MVSHRMHVKKQEQFMTRSTLEHVNFTVADATATAKWMCDLFGWKIRW